jgi:hypothetical protein
VRADDVCMYKDRIAYLDDESWWCVYV